jgi:2,4'-dihydroxyacetophenone dioxygenase
MAAKLFIVLTMQRDTLVFCNADDLPWAPWAMAGAHFKLLHADPGSARFSLLIKLAAGVAAPLHRHVGAVEGYVLSGSFHYHDQPLMIYGAGSYLLEREGAVHQPISPEGAVMFAVFHGPVEGLDAAGNVTGRVDWRWHVKAWKRHLAQANNGAIDAM